MSRNFAVLGLFMSTSALALASPALAEAEAAPAETGGLVDIVVTAQKRAQNLQDVPIAISAIGAAKVEQLGIKDSRDLSGLAPNVVITQPTINNSAAVFSMRGISNGGSESFGIDAANGLYVDGVYIARGGAMGMGVMDIERVEVLRGPQGTLFGRNTTGGAIHFITRAPSSDFRLTAEAGYGNFNAWNGKISVDPGAIGGIATSFSYAHSERHGTIDNILEPRKSKDPGARRSDAFRVAARAEIGGTGSIQYIFDWTRINGSPMAFMMTNVADGSPRPPADVDGQLVSVTQQAPVAGYLAEATHASAECAALAEPARVYRKRVCNDITSTSLDKSWGHNLQIQNDFGPFKIKSTTGYRFWRNHYVTDLDGIAVSGPLFTQATLFNGMPAGLLQYIPSIPAAARAFIAASPVPTTSQNLFDNDNRRWHKQFSQELEISGDADALDWVVGGFFFWESGSEDGYQNSGFILDTNSIFTQNFGALAPSFIAANPARYRLVQTLGRLAYNAKAESTAIYGQFTFYPGGRDSGIRLTAGGRYTWDEKKMIRTQNGAALPLYGPELGYATFSKFTWNLMAGYDVADGVNLYARAATGYRSGGFNSQDTAIYNSNKLGVFNPEKVTSYEIGLKSELFNRRLRFNVAAYHNIYDDLAVLGPVTDAAPGTFATRIINAGKVVYNGFEIETQAILNDNFSIDGSLGYIDINYKQFLAGQPVDPKNPIVNIASVVTPGFTSPWTGNVALNAQFPLAGDMTLRGRIGYTHEDGKYNFSSSIGSPFNEEIKGDAIDLVDVQLGVEGIPLGTGEGSVRLWVKNLTDAKDFVRSIDFGALGYAGGYYAEPRTYGVTVGVKF